MNLNGITRIVFLAMMLSFPLAGRAQQFHPPHYPGGDSAIASYLEANLNYPEGIDSNINGDVIVRITIDTDGRLVNPLVVRGLGEAFDSEALRVLEAMPLWEPAHNDEGYTLPVSTTIPIHFYSPEYKEAQEEKRSEKEEKKLPDYYYPNREEMENDHTPFYPGGDRAMKKFITKWLEENPGSDEQCQEMLVFFAVETDGRTTGVSVRYPNDASTYCKNRVKKLFRDMPAWVPGRANGKNLRMTISKQITL